jgi:hypothetical protein
MTTAAGSVWLTDPQESGNGLVIRIDPTTTAVTARIPFARIKAKACGDLAGDDKALWVVSGCNGRLLARIDPSTNKVVGQIALGAIAASGTRIRLHMDNCERAVWEYRPFGSRPHQSSDQQGGRPNPCACAPGLSLG